MVKRERLFHGSPIQVKKPAFGVGSPYNDFGQGFYCTPSHELASEWACPTNTDGFVNTYDLDMSSLRKVDLLSDDFTTLNWLTLLLMNRRFDITSAAARQIKEYLVATHYPHAVDQADVIVGYRADDSYFSFAKAFLDNRITLRQLEYAMKLGNLGSQTVLKSEKAFEAISFVEAEAVPGAVWFERRLARDRAARNDYKALINEDEILPDDLFAIDILRRHL